MPKSREITRDERDFDTTQLKMSGHGRTLHRDYSAHFWRWSFARNFIKTTDSVLEIGCGEEKPLSKILTGGAAARVDRYVGVDLNKLKPSASKRLDFYGEFNFITKHKELVKNHGLFDVVVHLEVIEHMKVIHGRKMLKACWESLKPGGIMLMSTPCYDGKRHAANHIHEYTIPELRKETEKAGFEITARHGAFMDIRHIKKVDPDPGGLSESNPRLKSSVVQVYNELKKYYDNDALSCFFAPLYPDHSRNNLWVCQKIGKPEPKSRKKK